MKNVSFLAAVLGFAALVCANSRFPGHKFRDDSHWVAMQASPMWHFARPRGHSRCYPEDAIHSDGSQNQGTAANKDGNGCANPGPWNGANSPGNPMPTYYTVKRCDADNSWRVTYSLYFAHDLWHQHDWEWVSVVWWQDAGTDNWYRGALIQSYHKGEKPEAWGHIQNTVDGWNDLFDQGKKDHDHPKVYVGAYEHAMFTTRDTSDDNPSTLPGKEFRSNDWYFFPWDTTMQDGLTTFPTSWTFGKAASTPAHLFNDICGRWEKGADGN